MLDDLLPLIVALTVATIVYVLRERRRRRHRLNPPRPDLTTREAWEMWRRGARNYFDGAFVPAGIEPGVVSEHVQEGAGLSLGEAERLCNETENPRLALRRAILESAAISLHLAAISELGEAEKKALLKGYAEGMDELLQDAFRISTLRWMVLRQYARLKYDDATNADWFHHFMHVAGPYIGEKVRLARDSVLQVDKGSGRFVEIYDELLSELRKEMIKVRPKKRFVPPDLK
jgi:hypothetical protein